MTDAEYMRSIRKALYKTQEEIADRLGYKNRENISDIERGKAPMSPQTRAQLKTIEIHEIN